MTFLMDMLSFAFIRRALLVGIFVSLCAALLGVSLVLKRFSMIGDGLSHVSFGALSVALAFGWAPLKFSIPIVAIAAFFLLRITERAKVKSDAAIAVVSASSLAIGIIVTALKTGINTDVASYMFGSILAMGKEDVWVSLILSIVVLGMFVICYHRIFAITFDENFAQATGVSVSFYNTLIAILTAITVVLGMRRCPLCGCSSGSRWSFSVQRFYRSFASVSAWSVRISSIPLLEQASLSQIWQHSCCFASFRRFGNRSKNVPFKPNRNHKFHSHFNKKQMIYNEKSSAFLFSFVGRDMKSL